MLDKNKNEINMEKVGTAINKKIINLRKFFI